MHTLVLAKSHEKHAAPPVPHVVTEGVRQWFDSQHAVEHDVPVHWHVPPAHCWPDSHVTHATPPVPHAASLDAMQVAPMQQPVLHDVAVH